LGQDRLAAYRDHGADRIVAEINNGGEMASQFKKRLAMPALSALTVGDTRNGWSAVRL
jgi:phage terminase large subunit-like protein